MNTKKKIGIMGGTFDPIHLGHLILGKRSYEQLSLSRVLFMPAGHPPHKQHREGRASDSQRVEMVRLAIADNPHFELSLREMNEDGFTYTYRTLEKMRAEDPDAEYYFILGADSLLAFDTWMKPERIAAACTVVAAVRNNTSTDRLEEEMDRLRRKYNGSFVRLDTENIDISSHMLRSWAMEGRSLKYYLPDSVIDYIRKEGIYAGL